MTHHVSIPPTTSHHHSTTTSHNHHHQHHPPPPSHHHHPRPPPAFYNHQPDNHNHNHRYRNQENHHYPHSSSSSASIRGCCCCLILLFSFLALVAATVVLVIVLAVKPKKPQFELQQVAVQYINLAAPVNAPATATTTASLSLAVRMLFTAKNDNKVGIKYGVSTFNIMYRGIPLGRGTVPGFYQPAHSVRQVQTTVTVDRVNLMQADAADLVRDASLNDRVELRMMGDVNAKIRILGLTSPSVQVQTMGVAFRRYPDFGPAFGSVWVLVTGMPVCGHAGSGLVVPGRVQSTWTGPGSLRVSRSVQLDARIPLASIDCAIAISPRKQALTYKQCGFDGLKV
ncbi:hypothetical protein OSB04_006588 [Centaurea solstitialis]|uniref:Late embryogenesis abundant protein LEA-2 subgroup domain-containing protein n=1 Tax=Centaurea solstitialis TaxID=347529 RepID=A0AA38U2T3_9ASTR|nr:hypothetical protein OSB04_006588 [Centaurea solstitialis]